MNQKIYYPITEYSNTNGQPHYKCPVCKKLVHCHNVWMDTDGKYKCHEHLKETIKATKELSKP